MALAGIDAGAFAVRVGELGVDGLLRVPQGDTRA